jgi:O-antigen ligase
MAVTTLTSSMPLVSAKFLLSRMWLVAGYYFLMATLLSSLKDGRSYFLAYMIPLAVVVIYTLVGFAERGLNKNIAVWVMSPLFKEHTSYGAVLAMYFPAAVILAVAFKEKLLNRGLLLVLLGLLTIGLITSYTRAAWLSVFVAAGAAALVFLRINRWQFGIVAVLGLVGAWFLNDQFFGTLQRNTQDSSDDISEHVQSISNISTDASNLERINRWNSALRMWHERPVVGFGPGTYQFQYAPYQNPYEKTIISTNAGDVGNAHSEYLGPLAEQGLPGMLLVLILFGLILWTGVKVLYREAPSHRWYLTLAAWLGLITYMAHGFLNNFLEMDKAALPFWGFAAWLVLEDIRTSALQKKL